MIEYIYSAYTVTTHLQWRIWESYALSCVYGYVLWDTHTIAVKLYAAVFASIMYIHDMNIFISLSQ